MTEIESLLRQSLIGCRSGQEATRFWNKAGGLDGAEAAGRAPETNCPVHR